jgi:hypothetical protein
MLFLEAVLRTLTGNGIAPILFPWPIIIVTELHHRSIKIDGAGCPDALHHDLSHRITT